MKILLITSEEWNDYVYCNGVLTNWFTGFPAEFAQIYISPGLPNNSICKRYFQITDSQMFRSLIGGSKAGSEIKMPSDSKQLEVTKLNARRKGIYGFMKKLTLWCRTPVVALQDVIWAWGRYDIEALSKFVKDFNPDVVFCPRMVTPKLIRLERLIHTMTDAPFIAFTADDEASYQQCSWSPLFWIRRWWMHNQFEHHVPGFYKHYWTFSEEQAVDYSHRYGVSASTLYKCGDFPEIYNKRLINTPIRLIFAGHIYCNRWKSLKVIGDALKVINRDKVHMFLDVFTTDELTNEQLKALSEERFIYMKGAISPERLAEEYANADIALHVESFDKKYRLATRVSFSTKIIDLMATGCAILAVCWNRHAGYQYLNEHDAAFCVDNYKDILPLLQKIVDNPNLIHLYAEKAYKCGKENHNRKVIQDQIIDKFNSVIAKKTNVYG
jgi:hypothetical protein